MSGKPDISVCVATFRRPDRLRRLLDSLAPQCSAPGFAVEVIVVDNDREESARPVVEAASRFPRIAYHVEPVQNISRTRNRALDAARGDWIAFIDDDEIASERWLASYVAAARARSADGFFGPIDAVLEEERPSWLDDDRAFRRVGPADDGPLDASHTRTGNAFLRRSLFETHRFDPAFGLTGGSDLDLFTRMIDAGARFHWCEEARTVEHYPRERLRFRWVLQRMFRLGYTWTLVDRKRRPGFIQVVQLAKATLAIAVLSASAPLALLGRRRLAAKCLFRLVLQAGHIAAFFGVRYEEYAAAAAAAVSAKGD